MATTRLLSAMVATWNNVATTFTGLKLNVTDTASASGSLLMDLQVDGSSKFNVGKAGNISSAAGLLSLGGDVIIRRDAANTLALRNGTAAQKFNVYNTYTDASNYERGVFDWAGTANTLRIGTEAAGTGTVRNIQLVAGSNSVTATVGASNLLTLNGGLTTGALITSGGSVAVGPSNAFFWTGRSILRSSASGIVSLLNAAETGFTRLILGTNDTSGVAIKKNGTAFNFRLGDDSGDADITAANLRVVGYVKTNSTTVGALPAAATVGAGARSFVTDATVTASGNFGATVTGGGSNKVPVYSDGTDWLIG